LEHKIGMDLTVSLTLKKPSKNYTFYSETFRINLNPSSVKKIYIVLIVELENVKQIFASFVCSTL